jgi:hypothetical protein
MKFAFVTGPTDNIHTTGNERITVRFTHGHPTGLFRWAMAMVLGIGGRLDGRWDNWG